MAFNENLKAYYTQKGDRCLVFATCDGLYQYQAKLPDGSIMIGENGKALEKWDERTHYYQTNCGYTLEFQDGFYEKKGNLPDGSLWLGAWLGFIPVLAKSDVASLRRVQIHTQNRSRMLDIQRAKDLEKSKEQLSQFLNISLSVFSAATGILTLGMSAGPTSAILKGLSYTDKVVNLIKD